MEGEASDDGERKPVQIEVVEPLELDVARRLHAPSVACLSWRVVSPCGRLCENYLTDRADGASDWLNPARRGFLGLFPLHPVR